MESEASSELLQDQLERLALDCLAAAGEGDDDNSSDRFADVRFDVQGRAFRGHKAVFSQRSDYFRALFADHFAEADGGSAVPTVRLRNVAPEVFEQVFRHVYCDRQEVGARC